MGPLYLGGAILFNVIANAFLRMGATIEEMSLRKGVLIGAGLLIGFVNTLCYIKSLESISLGTAFALFAAVSTILIAGVSAAFFGEGISLQKGIGLLTICAGLLLIRG
jgi:multidrug transporter EmrE-like cation transporter